jgi:hypothetical protein
VKEEKLLLMAKEAEDLPSLLDTVKQIINNCCLEDINVDELPLFEIELVFIHLRLKSVGENLELTYKCENIVEEQPCGASMTFEVDLSQVTIEEPESHTNKIMITEDIGVMLKYPSLKISSSMAEQVNSIENIVDLIYEHLDYVFDDTSKYDAESITKEELYEFLGSMSLDQLEPFKEFFSTLPYVKAEKDIQCEKCGYQHKIVVRGIDDFFG